MKPKRTILCVDDNEQSLSHRKIMLETRGYRVASFSRGEEALARFVEGGVDLVIADMAMPGLDGPQLIAKIKDMSPHTPAILISSKVRIYDHDSQADVFLTKGMYAPVDLLERVRLCWCASAGPSACSSSRLRKLRAKSAQPESVLPYSLRSDTPPARIRRKPSCKILVRHGRTHSSKQRTCARRITWAKLRSRRCAGFPSACRRASSSAWWARRAAGSRLSSIFWAG